mgnify:CR=1 FL=1
MDAVSNPALTRNYRDDDAPPLCHRVPNTNTVPTTGHKHGAVVLVYHASVGFLVYSLTHVALPGKSPLIPPAVASANGVEPRGAGGGRQGLKTTPPNTNDNR